MSDTNAHDNPHFNNVDRAPYELGCLLQRLPADFYRMPLVDPDVLLIAEAARDHANHSFCTPNLRQKSPGDPMRSF